MPWTRWSGRNHPNKCDLRIPPIKTLGIIRRDDDRSAGIPLAIRVSISASDWTVYAILK